MRRYLSMFLIGVVALISLAGCDPAAGPKPSGPAASAAAPAVPAPNRAKPGPTAGADDGCKGCPAAPNPGQEAPAPAADPGPYNDIHSVVVNVWWHGERQGSVVIQKNGVVYSNESVPRPRDIGGGKYVGGYRKDVLGVQKGDDIEVMFRPNPRPTWIMLAIYHNSRIASTVQLGQPGCFANQCATHAEITL
jgi:hypothetical protein